jgi:hypothetical protein
VWHYTTTPPIRLHGVVLVSEGQLYLYRLYIIHENFIGVRACPFVHTNARKERFWTGSGTASSY